MKYIFVLFCSLSFCAKAQVKKEKLVKLSSAFTMFPDSLRKENPRVYNNKTYNWQEHHNDSSVLVYLPSRFNKKLPFKIVIWIHGWYNNIDSAFAICNLKDALDSCQQNFILLMPEGAKNAPDSYAGKWEKPNYFNWFLADIQKQLIKQKLLLKPTTQTIYAGHSGAYKAIANMLQFCSAKCQAVILFDALYGETYKFYNYIKANPTNYFFNIYCKDGGTYKNSVGFSAELFANNYRSCNKVEQDISPTAFEICKIAHIYSNLGHNEVVTQTKYFRWLLQNVK